MEEWKDVVGYEGMYQVSNHGRVKSLDREIESIRCGKEFRYTHKGMLIKAEPRNHGYLSVSLYGHGGKNGRFKQKSVHRLVAEAFVPNPNGFGEVNHIDEDKTNNFADNLEWCDRKHNCNHGTIIQRRSQKATNGKKSRPIVQMGMNGEYIATFPSMAEANRTFGFAQGNIHKAIHGVYSQAYGYKWKYAD